MSTQHELLLTEADLASFYAYADSLDKNFYLSFDLETDGVQEKTANIFGIGICFGDNSNLSFYIPIRRNTDDKPLWWSKSQTADIYAKLTTYLKEFKLIGWNLIYDVLVWKNNTSFDVADYIHSDGILLKHCVDEERPFGLKETAVKYLGAGSDDAQKELYDSIKANGGKTTKTQMDMWKADTEVLGKYCAWDCALALRLHGIFYKMATDDNVLDLYWDEVMPLYKLVTIPMKDKGFPVNVPHFEKLNQDIVVDIEKLEREIREELAPVVAEYETYLLDKEFETKPGGNLPRYLAKELHLELPTTTNGRITTAKAALQKLDCVGAQMNLVAWMLREAELTLSPEVILNAKRAMWKDKKETDSVFNINSNKHLQWLLYSKLGLPVEDETDGGDPQVSVTVLKKYEADYAWLHKLLDYKKLQKLKSTYIEAILEKQLNGVLHTSMLQFGTTSGRYSSTSPNLQNIPRAKGEDSNMSEMLMHYTNSIREGFYALPGYKLIDADYSALEPRAFASVSGDKNLQSIFFSGEDMYSAIAVRTFKVEGVSTFKKDDTFLGKIHPELRQRTKIFSLAPVYGASAYRLHFMLDMSVEETSKLIDDYFNAYPGLINYIDRCHVETKTKGYVMTRFGRKRHLPEAKDLYDKYGDKIQDFKFAKFRNLGEQRSKFKNLLNNSTNFPIQGLAAHIVNKACIAIAKAFKAESLDASIVLQVHDEIIVHCHENIVDKVKAVIQDCMENTTKIEVPLVAEPQVANNWKEAK